MAGMTFDQDKFDELVLHIAHQSSSDPNFGKTKLNKLLFYADFLAYGIFGQAITGASYQRRDFGPVPREITAARTRLVENERAHVETKRRFNYQQERLVADGFPNLTVFKPEEVTLVDQVIGEFWPHSGYAASELSHTEVGWKVARDKEVIPYDTVFLSCRKLPPYAIRRGQEVYAEAGRVA